MGGYTGRHSVAGGRSPGRGRWHRYYGFVGCYGLARVPAEEIEFPWFSPFDVGSPANSMVSFPVVLDEAFEICWMSSGPSWIWKISDPLGLVVRNRSAMERTLPPLLAGGDVKPPGDAVAINTRLCWMHPLAYRNPPADPWTALISKTPTPITFKRPMRPSGAWRAVRDSSLGHPRAVPAPSVRTLRVHDEDWKPQPNEGRRRTRHLLCIVEDESKSPWDMLAVVQGNAARKSVRQSTLDWNRPGLRCLCTFKVQGVSELARHPRR